jgi:microcystin-dependent protein
MSALILPHTIVNDTTADADPVRQNYNFIADYVNAETITRDGALGMEAPLLLNPAVTQPNHAATKAYVDLVLPIGIMLPYGGVAPPGGGTATWMLCAGQTLNRSTYAALFGVLSTRFDVGVVSGSEFMLPNLAGRMIIGVDATDADCDVVGETGGTTTPPLKTHTHLFTHGHGDIASSGESATHSHTINHDHPSDATSNNTVAASVAIPARANATAFGTGSLARTNNSGTADNMDITTTGGSHAHNADLPLYSGSSGTESATHTHTTTIASTAFTTPAPVETVDTKYRPPYLTVSYIIRVL